MSVEYTLSGTTLQIQTQYDDFGSFMAETKDPVYRTISTAFKELSNKKQVTVTVKALVENIEFESVLEFTKENSYMLTDIIIPFFESVEDYETCAEVLNTHRMLVGK